MIRFGAVIRKDDECGYWAEIPDLEGCYGQGNTFNEVVESVSNGLETHLAAMLECAMDMPAPTKIKASDGEVVYISVNPGAPCAHGTIL